MSADAVVSILRWIAILSVCLAIFGGIASAIFDYWHSQQRAKKHGEEV